MWLPAFHAAPPLSRGWPDGWHEFGDERKALTSSSQKGLDGAAGQKPEKSVKGFIFDAHPQGFAQVQPAKIAISQNRPW
jgi:hypothetical protein